jgi:integrase
MPKREKGNGVREVSPGKFVATSYDPRAKGGTKHVGTFTVGERYPTRTAARKAAERAKQDAEELRDLQLKSPSKDETCESFARRWPRDYTEGRGISTVEHNTERTKAFIRDFGDRPMRAVEPVEARAWIVGGIVPPQVRHFARHWDKARTLPDGDVEVPNHHGWLNVIRAMFNDALKTELVDRNPFANLRLPEPKGHQGEAISVVTERELALLIQTAHEVMGDYGRHFGACIEFAAWTGLRPGELWALDIEKHISPGEIKVEAQIDKRGRRRPPKWGSARIVFLLPPAASALQRAIGDRTEGPVFLNKRDGARLTGRSLGYYWDQIRTAFWAKLPEERRSALSEKEGGPEPGKIAVDFDFYELRHAFGTYLGTVLRLSPPEIANQMGHKDGGELAMKRYIHPEHEHVKRSMLERFADEERRRKMSEDRSETG